ncbi:unnamed protein product, partial [marine sediment metagenome]
MGIALDKSYKQIMLHLPKSLYSKILRRCEDCDVLISEEIRSTLREKYGDIKPGNPVKAAEKKTKQKPKLAPQKIDYAKNYLNYGKWNAKNKTWTCKLCGSIQNNG